MKEHSIIRNSQYTRSLIEASLDPLVTISPEGKITDVNEASIKVTGVSREKLINTDFSNYFTDPIKAQEGYLQVFEKGFVSDYPLTIKHENGNLTDVSYNASVYKDDKGNVLGVFAAARDITAQKQASQYARSLIEASLDPLVTISSNGKVTDVNQASVEVTGISREKLIGTDFSNYFTDPIKAQKGYLQVFEKGFVIDYPLTIRHKNGKLTDVSYNASIYKDNNENILGVFAAARDVTAQKWAQDLRNANKALAFQNVEKEMRAAELIIANKELAFQNEEKEKRAAELIIANKELIFQSKLKEKKAIEKEKRASELVIANKELSFQNKEKEKRAAELLIANKELAFQNKEKEKRAAELVIANKELALQIMETAKQSTANKVLEASNIDIKLDSQYTLSLIEASLDPLVTINAGGKITDMNRALTIITGQTREELTDTNFLDYFTEPIKARAVYKEVFKKGSVNNFPLTLRHKSGKLTDVLFNGSVYKDDKGNVDGVVIVARDVTTQKRIERELNEAIVFAELATSIAETAQKKAEDAVKAKQQFLSNMSHEIRTPMNAIIGFTKVLLKTGLTPKQKEYLQAVKLSGDALIVLINDILDLAKVDAGKMTFEQVPFKMEVSIAAMLHMFKTKIQEKNIKLEVAYDPAIPKVLIGDPVRLHQIILNLVSNAIKFTNQGKITVSVGILKEDKENVSIEFIIKDTGIGISAEKLPTIFENFQQASSNTSRLYGGTGLGLAIVKQLVEPQGGSIHVESIEGKGSTFSFILSFQKTHEESEFEDVITELNSEMNNIKVLVVEDIALNQLLMRTLLDDFGFECTIAANGRIAIEELENNSFDIILMDLQMPEMNGFEATEYIRNFMNSDIPIIALTADVTTVDLEKCKAVGMNDYVAKPVDEHLLYGKIVGLINKSAAIDDHEMDKIELIDKVKYTDLTYLKHRTKSNPVLIMEMISLYLEQTPPLISTMKQGLREKDWQLLYSTVHKMIPSFSIMGMNLEFENMAKEVQEFARTQQQSEGIPNIVKRLENVCTQACEELKEEYKQMKYNL